MDEEKVEDLLGALEDIADALKDQKRAPAPEVRPVINVPQSPAPVVNQAPVTVEPPAVNVAPAQHPFANGFKVAVERDMGGNASVYRFSPLS